MAMTTNYWHGTKPTRYEVNITLDFSIPSERAKRILTAGITEAVREKGFVKDKDSQVLIDCTNELGVVYKIRYWITPWSGISPSLARDRVLFTLLKHLDASGITPAYPKEDVYHENMPSRQLDSNKTEDRSKLLSRIDIFSILRDEELNHLSSRMQKRVFSEGETIVRQNDEGESMFILFEGLLDVMIEEDGTEVNVATLSPPEYFGEMSLLTGEKRTGTVVCLTDAVVYEIGHRDFTDLLYHREEIIEQIAHRITIRRSINTKRLEEERHQRNAGEDEVMRHSLIYRIRNYFTGAFQNQ
jgi:CRP-like cAMP-binding protein